MIKLRNCSFMLIWCCLSLSPALAQEGNFQELHVKALHSGKCLTVHGGKRGNGKNVDQWICRGQDGVFDDVKPNQQWSAVSVGHGLYQIKASHSRQCLTVHGNSQRDGANVDQWTCRASDNLAENQLWRIVPNGEGFYRLIAAHSGKCLTVHGNGLEGRWSNSEPDWFDSFW